MYKTTLTNKIKTDGAIRTLPRVKARFNLNQFAEYVTCADANRIDLGRPPKRDYGRIVFAETSNVIKPFRYAHGVTYPIIRPSTSDTAKVQPLGIVEMQDNKHDEVMQFIPSADNTYRYFISSRFSTKNTDSYGIGYAPLTGNLADIKITYCYPDISQNDPFFVLQERNLAQAPEGLYDAPVDGTGIATKPMFLHGNAVHLKFNTTYTKPAWFKVHLGWRPYDSDTSVITETTIYDSAIHGVPQISTGQVYSAVNITDDGGYCKLFITQEGTNLAFDPPNFKPGDNVVLSNVDSQVNGIYKILKTEYGGVSRSITISAPFVENKTLDPKTNQVYSAAPGELTFYMPSGWGGTGAWSEQENLWTEGSSNLVGINYVRLEVLSIDKKDGSVEVIEIMPALYADLTDNVMSANVEMEGSTTDPVMPVGNITSNNASVTFDNSTKLFDQSNYRRKTTSGWVGSPIAMMLLNNVEFWIDAEMSTLSTGAREVVPMGVFISESWNVGKETASVDLSDYAKIFMERKAPDLLLRSSSWIAKKDFTGEQNMSDYKSTFKNKGGYSVTAIVQLIMAGAGWTQVMPWPDNGTEVTEPRLRYFWCRQEQTVWDALQKLAESTQTSIFFDRFGYLRILPRDKYSDINRGIKWRFSNTKQGTDLPDIVDITRTSGEPLSRVEVTYNTFSSVNEGGKANTVFWTPPDNMQLRLAELVSKIEKGATTIKIKPRAGVPWEPSGSLVFGNIAVDYDASAYFRTFGLPRGAKGSSGWTKWWVKDHDAIQELKELNDGYDVVPANILYVKNGLSGSEKTTTIAYDLNHPEDVDEFGGWKIRYVIDGANNQGGSIPGSQWRTFNRHKESWTLNCRRSEFPRGIKIPANSPIQQNDQYLIAYKDFADDDIVDIERVISKFQFVESDAGAAAGITLFNKTGSSIDRFYAVKVKLGDKFPGKKRNEPIVRMHRIKDDGSPENLKCDFAKEAGSSIEDFEWCILELEVLKAKEGDDGNYNYEFNVYLNGFLIGTFQDKSTGSLEPNTKAGFFVTNGIVEWDAFVAIEEGGDAPINPAKNKKQRKRLRSQMKKTQRKKKKAPRANRKSTAAHNRGSKVNKPKGQNKTRKNNAKRGGRR